MIDIESEIRRAIASLDVRPGRILFLHVRLKNLAKKMDKSYLECTRFLLESFGELNPAMMLVPSFTESFTKTGVHHSLFSKSESGRFSEEVRKNFARYRLPEPVHSVLCLNDELSKKEKDIDCLTAFGERSLYAYLHHEDANIINFDLDQMVSTQFHYVETVSKVPYRYLKIFSGVLYTDEREFSEVNYAFNVRDLDINPVLNRRKIEECLNQNGVLRKATVSGMKILGVSCQDLMSVLGSAIEKDPYFLVQ